MANDITLVTACIFYSITLIASATLTAMLFINFYRNERGRKTDITIRKTAVLFALTCCMRVVLLVVHYVGLALDDLSPSRIIRGEQRVDRIADWCQIGADLFLLFSKLTLYWHLVHRLKVTFLSSAYMPTRCILGTLNFFMAVTVAVTLTLCTFVTLYLLRQSTLIKSHSEDHRIFVFSILSALMISDLIISSLIMYSFINGLRQLVIDVKASVMMDEIEAKQFHDDLVHDDEYNEACSSFDALMADGDESAATNSPQSKGTKHPKQRTTTLSSNHSEVIGGVEFVDVFSRKQLLKAASKDMCNAQTKLVGTITKSTLLSSIAIGSTFCFLVLRIVVLLVEESDGVALVYCVFGALDATLDLFVVYLNFVFAKGWYLSCCHRCDSACWILCRNYAERGIYKANKEKYLYGDNPRDAWAYRAMV